MSRKRPSSSFSTSASTSYPTYSYGEYYTATTSRPNTRRRGTARSGTGRPRTGASSIARIEAQQVICAVIESRGISPTVGLSFVNLDTGESVLCQICDSQTYVRTIHKLRVYGPTHILIVATATSPKSKLFSIIEENLDVIGGQLSLMDRRYWAESSGLEYIQQLAFSEDVEAIKISVSGNYYAVISYIEFVMSITFPFHSLRIKYEPSEGSMMIDVSTIRSMELTQNLQNPKSRDCLFGLLNETLSPMGSRLLRSNILQPLTDRETLITRYDALEELTTKEEMFFATRAALKNFLDADKILTALIVIPKRPTIQTTEQSINHVIMLKQFVNSVNPIYEALTGARSTMLINIRELCAPENVAPVQELINGVINEDIVYASQPLELRNQRTYAVKSGVNGLLDVARVTYREAMEDAYQHSNELSQEYNLPLNLKYDNNRGFFIRIAVPDLEGQPLPPVFTNLFRRRNMIECQTLELMKRNHKITISHQEVLLMSDEAVQTLLDNIRGQVSILFKICESIGMLDMIAAFAQIVTTQDYVRPQITDTLAIKSGRHPIREKVMNTKFVPNDVYATQQSRFQVITGCNMSGKSTYIRSIALMAVMAQIGSFVPASYASFPIMHQLFARVSVDDSIEANISTFAAEMREMAFILRNVDKRSMVIVDELGRGTSPRDGLAIALAIAEALVQSRALVWFATHFRDIPTILAERPGVISLHLAAEITENNTMNMLYKIAEGAVKETHYGLALARLVPFPPGVVDHAEHVAKTLEANIQRNKKKSASVIRERRRKLILNLKEHLVQAQNGVMEGAVLTAWLRELQKEFVLRMVGIEEEASLLDEDSEDEQDAEMRDADAVVTQSEFDDGDEDEIMQDIKMESVRDEIPRPFYRHPSVVTVNSGTERNVGPGSESLSTVRAVSENER